MGEGDTEVGFGALCISFLCGLEVVQRLGVCAAMEVDESAIDVALGVTRLHDVRIRGAQGSIRTVRRACSVTNDEDLLSIVFAGDGPDAVELYPVREFAEDVGAFCAAVDFLQAHPQEACEMGERARKLYLEKYRKETIVRKYAELFMNM